MSQHKNVALLLTGNELMSGDTVDSNSSALRSLWASDK